MFYLALWLAKLLGFVSRSLNLGAGETWPGHLALKIDARLLAHLESRLKGGSVLISGTNGKTTTAYILRSLLESQGQYVVHNASGANLLNGLTSALIREADFFGRSHFDLGVFEVDEGNLPYVLEHFTPEIIILLNLSRDQLDRYGEIDLTLGKWRQAFIKLPSTVKILLNSEDFYLQKLQKSLQSAGRTLAAFNLESPAAFPSPLLGRFNQLNTQAAAAAAQLLGLTAGEILAGLSDLEPVFGRGEVIPAQERQVKILLAKNPASFNENLLLLKSWLPAVLTGDTRLPPLILVLNDNIPDGRDVSWIYDVDFEAHQKWLFRSPLFVSGKRASDLALRLKYAGLPIPLTAPRVSKDLKSILQAALNSTAKGGVLHILPTYSAMLEVRKILLGRAVG